MKVAHQTFIWFEVISRGPPSHRPLLNLKLKKAFVTPTSVFGHRDLFKTSVQSSSLLQTLFFSFRINFDIPGSHPNNFFLQVLFILFYFTFFGLVGLATESRITFPAVIFIGLNGTTAL